MRGAVPVINGWPVPTCSAGEYTYLVPDGSGAAVRGRLVVEFLDAAAYLVVQTPTNGFSDPYTVKPGEVFVLGDNRGGSMDSRSFNVGRGGGVPLEAIAARAQWFLVGTYRGGDPDFSRMLRPVDTLQNQPRLSGLDVQALETGVELCLASRPGETHPPPPDRPIVAQDLTP